jgi:hypothetical protein
MGISPAASTNFFCKFAPIVSSAAASENPDAKQVAPPAFKVLNLLTISNVACRLTQIKAASIKPGNASRDFKDFTPAISLPDG